LFASKAQRIIKVSSLEVQRWSARGLYLASLLFSFVHSGTSSRSANAKYLILGSGEVSLAELAFSLPAKTFPLLFQTTQFPGTLPSLPGTIDFLVI